MAVQPSLQERRPRALAELGLNSIYQSDNGTSSDDESTPQQPQDIEENDARSIVGVSLGPEQKRFTSAKTPANEKSAAIEAGGGFFNPGVFPSLDEAVETPTELRDDVHAGSTFDKHTSEELGRGRSPQTLRTSATEYRLPSPWRATPRLFQKVDDHRSALKTIALGRRRASTEGWQKTFMSNLSSLPKSLTFSTPFSSWRTSSNPSASASPQRAPKDFIVPSTSSVARSHAGSVGEQSAVQVRRAATPNIPVSDSRVSRPSIEQSSSRPPPLNTRTSFLRRSASDDSLQMRSALSRVSTLGDDSRFEDVKEQVNSRAKAIRDSLQDSNIRIPSFPSFSSLNLDSFRPDFSLTNMSNGSRKYLANWLDREGGSASGSSTPTPNQTARHLRAVGDPKAAGPSAKSATSHPHFTKACAEMTGDLVVLGGYRGSILRSAEPPHRQLWVPVKVGLNIRKVDMEVGLNIPGDDEKMESKIIPSGMLSHIGPVDISRRLFRRLRACDNAKSGKLRIHDYGYDWRLDPEFLSQRLIEFLEKLPSNQSDSPREARGATVIAHSLGGLITRSAINKRPDLFAGVVYAGTPTTCCNILGPLRNGDDVLLSSRVLTAQVNFTIRTSFALLPLDGKCFFNRETGEEFPVDFFDPQTWVDYRLSPCVARPLPPSEPPQPSMLDGLMSSLTSALPGVRSSISLTKSPESSNSSNSQHSGISQNAALEPSDMDHAPSSSIATTVTIPRDQALAYLTNTLARTKKFKEELSFRSEHGRSNRYPPTAVIYGKSTPTVYGAKVKDREAIKRSDAYDQLAFASGDGVVLAKAAMLPDGYEVARGGMISSERGHITLLGDLEAVGRALNAVRWSRGKGVGFGIND